MKTSRLTTAQAIVRFLIHQHSRRDGVTRRFIPKVLGIFGHGNVAGLGEALQAAGNDLPYVPGRNEQALVHTAAAFAKMSNRLQILACTSSIGPGATNMITGADRSHHQSRARPAPPRRHLRHPPGRPRTAAARIPGFGGPLGQRRLPSGLPVLGSDQPSRAARDLAPRSDARAHQRGRHRDRDLVPARGRAERSLGFPRHPLRAAGLEIRRPRPDAEALARAVGLIGASKHPLIVAGGGVLYSEASEALARFAAATGIPVAETQAGKGSLPFDHPLSLGAMGGDGDEGSERARPRGPTRVIGIGTRYSDFTTASKTAFQNPGVRFVNINVGEFDAFKHGGAALVADARETLLALGEALAGHTASAEWRERGRPGEPRLGQGSGTDLHPGESSNT